MTCTKAIEIWNELQGYRFNPVSLPASLEVQLVQDDDVAYRIKGTPDGHTRSLKRGIGVDTRDHALLLPTGGS